MNKNFKTIIIKYFSARGDYIQRELLKVHSRYETQCVFGALQHTSNDWYRLIANPKTMWGDNDSIEKIMDYYPNDIVGLTYREMISYIDSTNYNEEIKNFVRGYIFSSINAYYITGGETGSYSIEYLPNLIELLKDINPENVSDIRNRIRFLNSTISTKYYD